MPFRAVRWILVVLFILLDIFLFIWWQDGQAADQKTSQNAQNMIAEIRRQNIDIPPLSDEKSGGYYLAAKQGVNFKPLAEVKTMQKAKMRLDIKQSQVNLRPSGKWVLSRQQEFVDALKTDERLTLAQDYTFSAMLSNIQSQDSRITTYTAIQTYDDLPILSEKAQLRLQTKNRQVTSGTLQQLHDFEYLRDERPLISQETAIVSLYRYNTLKKGDHVKQMTLGYADLVSVNGYEIFVPVWAVWVQNDDQDSRLLMVNAFTSENKTP
jgi:regulatory protein YycI of two-component signal transduction system YycFG